MAGWRHRYRRRTSSRSLSASARYGTVLPAALGERAGIFRKHDLDLELLFTSGSGETMQATIAGSVNIGVAAGTFGVMGAYAKGAPIRVIGAEFDG